MMWLVLTIGFFFFVTACICLFRRYPRIQSLDERNRMDVAMKVWETGKPVIGTIDDDGNMTMKVLDEP